MIHSPRVSIVIPTRNRQQFLAQAVASCLAQTFADLEIIIVDDASTDETATVVAGQADPRIRYIRRAQSGGSVACINQGLALAQGEYLTWSSDDDYYSPLAIATMVQALDLNPAIGFVYTHYTMVDAAGDIIRPARVEDPAGLSVDNYVGHCFLYRREVRAVLGDYKAEPFLAEEYEYWLRVREKFGMLRIPENHYFHRQHPDALTTRYSEERMQEGVAQARRPYIAPWRHYFLVGERAYHYQRRMVALGHILRAIILNPFYAPAWRVLALLSLPKCIIKMIRETT